MRVQMKSQTNVNMKLDFELAHSQSPLLPGQPLKQNSMVHPTMGSDKATNGNEKEITTKYCTTLIHYSLAPFHIGESSSACLNNEISKTHGNLRLD